MFSKLAREITVACKTGLPQSEINPRLRAAIAAARDQNMPKDSIERAIRKASVMDEGASYEDVRYEGYGPGNVAIIVETITNNRNRTAAAIRAAFSKRGGMLGETNSVSFNFERVGILCYPTTIASDDAILEVAIEAGASDVDSDNSSHQIYCVPDDLGAIREVLEHRFGVSGTARLEWWPLVTVPVADENTAQSLLRFLELLEENDDVQQVVANCDIPKALMERLTL